MIVVVGEQNTQSPVECLYELKLVLGTNRTMMYFQTVIIIIFSSLVQSVICS